jgi:hypothetical protein
LGVPRTYPTGALEDEMTMRFLTKLALGAAALFALGVATPALACGKDCDCAKKADKAEKKDAPKPADKAGEKKADTSAPGATRLADEKPKCQCEKGGKGCTCEKGTCKCPNCHGDSKYTDAEKCKCKDGAKECGCEKGKCHCQPSKGEKKAA